MDGWKVTKYAAVALGVFVAVGVVLALVSFVLELLWTLLTTVVGLVVLAGVLYALAKGLLWLRDDGGTETADPAERLADRYVEGDLNERELERRLERELDGPDRDAIDRELERSRSE